MQFVITKAKFEDIAEVSHVHLSSFEGSFLNYFGEEFLRIYYENYLLNSNHLLLVAKSQNKIIGLIAGTLNGDLLYQTLFKNNFFTITKLVVKRIVINKFFRIQLLNRLYFIREAIKSRFFSKKKICSEKSTCSKYGKLLSIAVLKEFRGKEVSVALIEEFENEIKKQGALSCILSVDTDNLRGIGFYKKTGWHILKKTEDSIILKKEFTKNEEQ